MSSSSLNGTGSLSAVFLHSIEEASAPAGLPRTGLYTLQALQFFRCGLLFVDFSMVETVVLPHLMTLAPRRTKKLTSMLDRTPVIVGTKHLPAKSFARVRN